MSGERDRNDRQALAAEHALRVLSDDEAHTAARLEATDPGFAAEVARWRGRLAPLLAEIAEVQPPASLWHRIEAAAVPRDNNVFVLRRSVARWRVAAAGLTAIAASLGLVLLQQPRTASVPVVQNPVPPLVAMLGDDARNMKVMASWDPAARQLVLAVAGDMPNDPAHAHELWVIPADGKPRSLGTMPSSKQMHMRLADALAQLLQQGATIASSLEPPGGSPTGRPTGPVVASGSLDKA